MMHVTQVIDKSNFLERCLLTLNRMHHIFRLSQSPYLEGHTMVSTKKRVESIKKSAGYKKIKKTVISTASTVTEDIDKVKDVVLRDLQDGFETVSKRAKTASRSAAKATTEMASTLAETASDASVSVKESIAEKHLADTFRKLIDEVEEAAEEIKEGITVRFNQLREAAAKKIQPANTSPKKKSAVKKKAAAKKKTAAKKKSAVKKKTAAKKKSAVKKKAAVKKKVAPKKAAVKKKTSAKKKTATRKAPARKPAVKKK